MKTKKSSTLNKVLAIVCSTLMIGAGVYGAKQSIISVRTSIKQLRIHLGTQLTHNETKITNTQNILQLTSNATHRQFKDLHQHFKQLFAQLLKSNHEIKLLRKQQYLATKRIKRLESKLHFVFRLKKTINRVNKAIKKLSPQEQKLVLARIKSFAKPK